MGDLRSIDRCMFTASSKQSTATDTGERKLFADRFADYVPEVRPRIDPTQNVTVIVDLDLNHIKQMVLYQTIRITTPPVCLLIRLLLVLDVFRLFTARCYAEHGIAMAKSSVCLPVNYSSWPCLALPCLVGEPGRYSRPGAEV